MFTLNNNLFGFFLSFSEETPTEEKEKQSDILNIFSVASGHLYERFLR